MRNIHRIGMSLAIFFTLSACSTMSSNVDAKRTKVARVSAPADYSARMPQHIASGKAIIVDPRAHAWGAYDSNGNLIRAGIATAGGNWCPDIGRSCRTRSGTFRIQSLGAASCKSSMYPRPRGGAPMPYCMFFNGHQGLHGSPNVFEGNGSHGCVRLRTDDARWIRHDFATIGTKVIVRPY